MSLFCERLHCPGAQPGIPVPQLSKIRQKTLNVLRVAQREFRKKRGAVDRREGTIGDSTAGARIVALLIEQHYDDKQDIS